MAEVAACSQWLSGELEALAPDVVVLLGATAAQALLGRDFRVTQQRGVALHDTGLAPNVVATVHPASILRQRDAEARAAAKAEFVRDLELVKGLLRRTASRTG